MNGSLTFFADARSSSALCRYAAADGTPPSVRLLSGIWKLPVARLTLRSTRIDQNLQCLVPTAGATGVLNERTFSPGGRAGHVPSSAVEILPQVLEHGAEHLRRQHAGVGVVARAVIAREQRERADVVSA